MFGIPISHYKPCALFFDKFSSLPCLPCIKLVYVYCHILPQQRCTHRYYTPYMILIWWWWVQLADMLRGHLPYGCARTYEQVNWFLAGIGISGLWELEWAITYGLEMFFYWVVAREGGLFVYEGVSKMFWTYGSDDLLNRWPALPTLDRSLYFSTLYSVSFNIDFESCAFYI